MARAPSALVLVALALCSTSLGGCGGAKRTEVLIGVATDLRPPTDLDTRRSAIPWQFR
jgi:predicted small secreted protein